MTYPPIPFVVALLVSLGTPHAHAQAGSQPPGLRIVVLEGEDAINILQQKTAVAPVVEVRDRNKLPVGDRVVVLYEGRQLFDTGCVSTGGPQMRALRYSGTSSAITVQVQPNCRGGWGSAWSIEVACQQ